MTTSNNVLNLNEFGEAICHSNSSILDTNNMYAGSMMSGANNWKKISDLREWENLSRDNSGTSNGKGLPFRILSYNILAQVLLDNHSYIYTNCSPKDLPWEVRFARLCEEIFLISPDIICFQELQHTHVAMFVSHLEKHGYKHIYKQRTGIRVDGCAIFYKNVIFDLLDYQSVEFKQPNTDILNRDNIGLMAKLKPKVFPDIPIVVSTTHLLYNPKRSDVKIAQMQVFLAEIDRFSYHYKQGSFKHLPIILTGDFNSLPNSGVVRLLTDGKINSFHSGSGLKNIAVTDFCQHLGVYLNRQKGKDVKNEDLSMLYHSEKVEILDSDDESEQKDALNVYKNLFNKGFLKQNMRFKSVYEFVNPINKQYEATTHQDEWLTVDYIFYSSGNISRLELCERYRLPTVEECNFIGAIPNEYFGSDHFSLAAGFYLKPGN